MVEKRVCAAGVVAAVCLLTMIGCGGRGMPTVKVDGTVTFDGGPPPRAGIVVFTPVPGTGLEGLPLRPATAPFDEGGKFRATSFEKGDGLLPGRYQVRVKCVDGVPDNQRSYDDISLVPTDWSPDDLVVEKGQGTVTLAYDVPPKKKKW